MTHRKRCFNDGASDGGDYMYQQVIPKDILGIIGTYARPNLWMYWIYDQCKPNNELERSIIIEADTYRDVCIKIFNDNIVQLLQDRYVKLPVGLVTLIQNSEGLKTNENMCCEDGCTRWLPDDFFCYRHFPNKEILLKYHIDDEYKYKNIDALTNDSVIGTYGSFRVIKVRKLEW